MGGALAVLLLVIPVESAVVVEGVVESREQKVIFSEVDGTLADFAPTDSQAQREKTAVVTISNPGLMAELERTEISAAVARAKFEHAQHQGDANAAGMYLLEWRGNLRQVDILRHQATRQVIHAPMNGVWVAPELSRRHGKWVDKGEMLGSIYAPDKLRLRVAVDQFDAARIFAEPLELAEFCISRRTDVRSTSGAFFTSTLESPPVPAGRRQLFHPALGMQAGGEMPTEQRSDGQTVATRHFFEMRLVPESTAMADLAPGQKVLVRLVFGSQPMGLQWARRLHQFFSSR